MKRITFKIHKFSFSFTLNKALLLTVIFVIISALIFINLLSSNKNSDVNDKTVAFNIKLLNSYDFSNIDKISQMIEKQKQSSGQQPFDYNHAFENCAIIGDSITEGIEAYGYLGEDKVFTAIGGSVMKNESLFKSAANTHPKYAFFNFGMNDMGMYSGDEKMFIKKYVELLKEFKKISPKTNIFINSISLPSEDAMAEKPILKNYNKFNKALKEMSKKEKYTFVNTTDILKDHPDLYEGDGIHVKPKYYTIWLNILKDKAGI